MVKLVKGDKVRYAEGSLLNALLEVGYTVVKEKPAKKVVKKKTSKKKKKDKK